MESGFYELGGGGGYPGYRAESDETDTGTAEPDAMKIPPQPMFIADWAQIEPTRHDGESGFALWRTQNFGDIRVRILEYSPGYRADHWCSKGHVLLPIRLWKQSARWPPFLPRPTRATGGRWRSGSPFPPQEGDAVVVD